MITLPDTQPIVLRHIMSQDQCEQIINQLPKFTHSLKAKGPLAPGKWSENFINTQRIRLEEHTEQWIRDLLDIDCKYNILFPRLRPNMFANGPIPCVGYNSPFL